MIIEHEILGSEATTFHDFTTSVGGMELTISAGRYVQANVERFNDTDGATISIDTPSETTHYEVWLTETGISVRSRTDLEEFGYLTDPIDMLCWFTLPAGTVDLSAVDIEARRIVLPPTPIEEVAPDESPQNPA